MPNMDSINRFNKELDAKSSLEKESQKAQIESRKILQQIEKNTASLAEITKLLHESNLQHDQIIDLMGDLFAISKSKDNEEAQSLYQKAITNISSVGENVGNIKTLVNLATTIYNAVLPLLK